MILRSDRPSVDASFLPVLDGLDGTDAAAEIPTLQAGTPWATTDIAWLQFYDYSTTDELTGEPIIPRDGDRLHLVRDPENPHDPNAVQIWWRNSIRLGHLPRYVAAAVAEGLDAGVALRAYVARAGTGAAWSAQALLVDPAVAGIHARHVARVERLAWEEWQHSETARARREDRPPGRGRRDSSWSNPTGAPPACCRR